MFDTNVQEILKEKERSINMYFRLMHIDQPNSTDQAKLDDNLRFLWIVSKLYTSNRYDVKPSERFHS